MANWTAMMALPKTCDSGSQKYWVALWSMISTASTAKPSYVQLPCVSSTPLGKPVVPEV